MPLSPRLAELVAARRLGFSLPQAFYLDDEVYAVELAAIWRRGWLFVGYTGQLPAPGDYLSVAVADDPIVIIRGDDGQLRAFYNVCRHRGSLVCVEEHGHVGRLVCPYHQWTYGRQGELLSCRGMHEIDRAEYGLRTVHLAEVAGLVFVSLADTPPDFAPARQCLNTLAVPQGLDRAKIAHQVEYEIDANWKLVWENNRECYHCNANHPTYIRANFDHYNADDTTPRIRARIEAAVARSEARWAADGLAVTHKASGMTNFPDPEGKTWFSANRTPLVEGYLSETGDGRPVAPLMGDYRDFEVGTLRIRTLPNFWMHASCDHAVSTRLLPAGRQRTRAQVTWLVDAAAEEGRDYELARLLPFWQNTSEEDWSICRLQQRGVQSSGYSPGPLSTYKEYNVEAWLRWYLQQLIQAP
ncbi:MAG: aromatic ring-hydroxylating dioxygenase subunit alpha [Pirellulales bacterium]|nr:aromatic ring-hydroxylating dioxygenase subunit alpha [Pirellulales bacterium]